ncbi:SDR family NAD(P)-dependent oxidoreductase [Nonomuraea sp. NPDC052129]|uniref:SDR family NAD(P)-dependent oxidoreductase n=1 Tax=unclassified Nonomuraea TaxID=2593643 RepID=UPI00340D2F05
MRFAQKYGKWAVIAGASEGIGAAFAGALAERGLNLVLVARRPEPLSELSTQLGVQTITVSADLSTADGLAEVFAATEDREVGLVVCNAAYAPVGSFLDLDQAALTAMLDLNCRTPLLLARHYLPAMAARHRGGLVVMSSLAGNQGSPGIAAYAATKAFGAVLAEGLWSELHGSGVDVLTCVAGAVATPNLREAMAKPAPGTVTPDVVAAAALRALGRGPRIVPGALMRACAPLISHLLPRRTAITLMGRASRGLSAP